MIIPARKTYKIATEKSVPMKTRDGITLFADVVRPDAPGRFPVLLSRTPYNKKGTDDPNGPTVSTTPYFRKLPMDTMQLNGPRVYLGPMAV
jgi:predicted acyl esterase